MMKISKTTHEPRPGDIVTWVEGDYPSLMYVGRCADLVQWADGTLTRWTTDEDAESMVWLAGECD